MTWTTVLSGIYVIFQLSYSSRKLECETGNPRVRGTRRDAIDTSCHGNYWNMTNWNMTRLECGDWNVRRCPVLVAVLATWWLHGVWYWTTRRVTPGRRGGSLDPAALADLWLPCHASRLAPGPPLAHGRPPGYGTHGRRPGRAPAANLDCVEGIRASARGGDGCWTGSPAQASHLERNKLSGGVTWQPTMWYDLPRW